MQKQEFRCGTCDRLLAKGKAVSLFIKCRSCKTINHYGREPMTRTPASVEEVGSCKLPET